MKSTVSSKKSLKHGYVHVYTGDGKGKTTAAIGLAVRAAGAGLKVYIGQFIKGRNYSELIALKAFSDLITVEQYGRGCFISGKPSEEDRLCALDGLKRLREVLISQKYNIVIADEACCAVKMGLLTDKDLIDLITLKPADIELVFTGRCAPRKLIEKADLVTYMRCIKHYYEEGVKARRGIEM